MSQITSPPDFCHLLERLHFFFGRLIILLFAVKKHSYGGSICVIVLATLHIPEKDGQK